LLSSLVAWRVSLQRMRSDWPIVGAAWLITLLAATLLAAGPIYSDAVSLAGVRRVLVDAPTADANVEITAFVPPAQVGTAGAELERRVGAALGGLPASYTRSVATDTFALPDQQSSDVVDLTSFAAVDGIASHATLVDGEWSVAAPSDAPVQVAVAEAAASELGWAVGDVKQLTNRRDESFVLQVRVVGIYTVDDPEDPFWWGSPPVEALASESSSYRTFIPLVANVDDVVQRALHTDAHVIWHVFPAFDQLQVAQVPGLRARISELPQRIEAALAGFAPTTRTQLGIILAGADRSLLVTRTGVLLLIVQLAILAAYAIVLTAGLLAEHRRFDTALLRSRGAGPWQVAAVALVEGLVLAVPAAVFAPFLAAAGLALFNVAGPLASASIVIRPELSTTAFVVSTGAALASALLLVLPTFLSARTFAEEEGSRSRSETRTFGQRVGVDMALLAVTAIGFWQLRLYGAPLTQSVHGALGLDPLLVAAPAIGLLAGGVLALRVIPLLAQGAEAVTRRGRRLVGALGAQQMARRPLRYTRSALLLMLSVSMGVFAISYAGTWHRSQVDQAAFQVGADVRVQALSGVGSLPAWSLETAFQRLDGISTLTPVRRESLRLPGRSQQGELLGLDPARAAQVVTIRGDLAAQPLKTLLQPLAAARPQPPLVTLDTAPTAFVVSTAVDITDVYRQQFDPQANAFVPVQVEPSQLAGRKVVGAEVAVRDASGVTERFTAPPVELGNGEQQVVVPITAGAPRGDQQVSEVGGAFTLPLQILSVDITVTLPENWLASGGQVELSALSARSGDAAADSPLDLGAASSWTVSVARNGGPRTNAAPAQLDGMALLLDGTGATGTIAGPRTNLRPPAVSFSAASLESLADASLPVIVNQAFLDSTSARVGDTVNVREDAVLRQLKIVGVVDEFPTTEVGKPIAIADMSTMGLERFAVDHATQGPDEWWLATRPGSGDDVAQQIDDGPYVRGAVLSLADRTRSLSSDPVALGIIGALTLGFLVAGLFAAIGLVVSASVSARQRRTEFALMRALGLSARQLSLWLWLENAAVVVVSLVAGVALGLLIGWVALPFVTVTQAATAPFPPPVVITDWLAIGVLVAISSLALGLTVLALGRVLRRIGIGSVLRMGED
jgi:hypothetical protein